MSDSDPIKNRTLKSNMFEMDVVKDALQRRIEAGDITREDVETLRKSYTWVSVCTAVGMLSGLPMYIAMGRRVPRLSFPFKLFCASGTSMMGTFLGFTVGGAAASWEVHRKMKDTKRKLMVFEEIAVDARRAIAEHRMGIPHGTLISHRAGVPANDTFTPPGELLEPPDDVKRAVMSEMERRASAGADAPKDDDELARKQREFDDMLDRERKGGSEKRW
ncbi:hypothetical protein CcaverHIS002_0407690 [Cutaneotrichosporon cavernicola]|uniref:Uncharacterized protein n=1 Tax=Cutaneotrichosporon cavernicola TaxID=279322 RepID=A0AA48L4S7_9TREE|nr:uncharacterized protein CcaverHIS019_0407670 [Cutaneotrichosporon cavernicola]BEI84165.1 hypothetical protein CcaverHIS002_0407690 [Cutaneotrichosporon cavernicola]BEI91947.1 hypothetical protein CcaverHIS019_0407670 [Cutaneotrichosporon cavernicola]BEI99718.1 hypothetical protein CcaverHIS631_0407610 [Cutaneotrichosporon cavernicola]BEJ07494.1 hypothetical protein CcaverHIS641_0407630 [Cutaneotrichosporon cavernicola]